MASPRDRVSELLEGRRRKTRQIVTPEGVAISVDVADRGERLGAFLLDMLIWFGATIVMIGIAMITAFVHGSDIAVTLIAAFLSFLLRNLYFIHFELAWQGSTPGKRATGLKVIDRKGGALTPAAIVARNLTREAEFFLPVQLLVTLPATSSGSETLQTLTTLGWVLALTACAVLQPRPFASRRPHRRDARHRHAEAYPRRRPCGAPTPAAPAKFAFTSAQLQTYGAYELQVLEEVLRRPPNMRDRSDPWRHRAQQDSLNRIGWPI